MSYRAIALSHVDGAGGESIGVNVAQRLGFGYLNEAIVAQVAKDQGIEPTSVMEAERRKSFFARIGETVARGAGAGVALDPSFYLFDETQTLLPFDETETLLSLIRDAVRSAADRGSAVLVAHAACYACADRSDVLRVCVTAPFATRAARMASDRGLDEKEAVKLLHRSDAGRASYLKRVYGVDEESPTDYDAVINTERITPLAAVGTIVSLVGSHPVSDEPGYGQAAIGHVRTD